MSFPAVCSLSLFLVFSFAILGHGNEFSLRAPFTQEEGNGIPGWNMSGKTTRITPNYVRLTNNIRNMKGFISNQAPYTEKNLKLTAEFKIHSPEDPGADGMALWLASAPIKKLGSAFGGPERWNGVVVILDTYDNDGADPHPLIAVHYNEGKEDFQFADDGASTFVGGCYANYRNAELTRIHIFIEDDLFHIFVDPRGTNEWELCTVPTRVQMPDKIYFSVSAATGGFSDFHDIISLDVTTFEESPQQAPPTETIEKLLENLGESKHMREFLGVEDCIAQLECVNIDVFESIVETLDNLVESTGHELFTLQNSVQASTNELKSSTNPISLEVEDRRAEFHQFTKTLGENIENISKFRDKVMKQQNSDSDSSGIEYKQLEKNIASAHRLLNQIQRQQKSIVQSYDIQISSFSPQEWNFWMVLCILFGVIQLILVTLKFCTKGDSNNWNK